MVCFLSLINWFLIRTFFSSLLVMVSSRFVCQKLDLELKNEGTGPGDRDLRCGEKRNSTLLGRILESICSRGGFEWDFWSYSASRVKVSWDAHRCQGPLELRDTAN